MKTLAAPGRNQTQQDDIENILEIPKPLGGAGNITAGGFNLRDAMGLGDDKDMELYIQIQVCWHGPFL